MEQSQDEVESQNAPLRQFAKLQMSSGHLFNGELMVSFFGWCPLNKWPTVAGHLQRPNTFGPFDHAIAVQLVRGDLQVHFREDAVKPEDQVEAGDRVDLKEGGYEEAERIGYRDENDVDQVELYKRNEQSSQNDNTDTADVREFVCLGDVHQNVDQSLVAGRFDRAEAVALLQRIAALVPHELKMLKFSSSAFGVLVQQSNEQNDEKRIQKGNVIGKQNLVL